MTGSAPSTASQSNRRTPTLSLSVAGTALLLIDVINDLAFPGSGALVVQAEPMARRLAVLKRRAAAAGVPVIYVNDNFGQWRSDDCIVSNTVAANEHALQQIASVMKGQVAPSTRLRFHGRSRTPKERRP